MSSDQVLKQRVYKWCVVPMCTNTTITSNKLFIHVPKNPEVRKKWIAACGRNSNNISDKSTIFCCEDHFDMENDVEHWLRYRMMGGLIKMKPGVVPHIFKCQSDRKSNLIHPPRRAAAKHLHTELIEHAIRSEEVSKNCPSDETSMENSCNMVKVSIEINGFLDVSSPRKS